MNIASPLETGTPLTMPTAGAPGWSSPRSTSIPAACSAAAGRLASHYLDWTQPGFRAVAAHRFGSWVEPSRARVWCGARSDPSCGDCTSRCTATCGIITVSSCRRRRRRPAGRHRPSERHRHSSPRDDWRRLHHQAERHDRGAERRAVTEAPAVGRRVELGAGAAILGAVTDRRRGADWPALRRHDRRSAGSHGLRQPTADDFLEERRTGEHAGVRSGT